MKTIDLPLSSESLSNLHAGDVVLLNGTLLTGRDAAHIRFEQAIKEGRELPIDFSNQVIYYVGPTNTPPGHIMGASGPTSSYRMDKQTPLLLEKGLKGMIGKGTRSENVRQAIVQYGAVYFAAVGGAAALIAKSIRSCEILCYSDLGTEAVRKLEVVDFPAVVVIDSLGDDLYSIGQKKYRKNLY